MKQSICLFSFAALLSLFSSNVRASISDERAQQILETTVSKFRSELAALELPFRYQFQIGDQSKYPDGWKKNMFDDGGGQAGVEHWFDPQRPFWYIVLDRDATNDPMIDEEQYAATVCHELGHVIGGNPKMHIPTKWAITVEGQADYFSTHICLKKVLPEIAVTPREPALLKEATKVCKNAQSPEFKNCVRIAGLTFARWNFTPLGYARRSTPDGLVGTLWDIESINNWMPKTGLDVQHPDQQCRFNTMLAGAICPLSTALCSGTPLEGARPTCWFGTQVDETDVFP